MRDYARHTPSALRARPPILEGQFLQVVNKKNRVKHDIYRHIIILLLVLVAPLLSPQGGKAVAAATSYLPLGGGQVGADTIRYAVQKTSPANEKDLERKAVDLRNPENLPPETTYDEKTHTYIVVTR